MKDIFEKILKMSSNNCSQSTENRNLVKLQSIWLSVKVIEMNWKLILIITTLLFPLYVCVCPLQESGFTDRMQTACNWKIEKVLKTFEFIHWIESLIILNRNKQDLYVILNQMEKTIIFYNNWEVDQNISD
jgi:hypothetical protein